MSEVFEEIAASLDTGKPLVVATVASSRGSTPRKPGAKMAVRPDGSFCGTIGGGCGEAEVWQAAMDTMRDGQPRLVRSTSRKTSKAMTRSAAASWTSSSSASHPAPSTRLRQECRTSALS